VWLSAPGFRTAHLDRHPERNDTMPLTVCGRVMRNADPAPDGLPRCRHCAYSAEPAAEPAGVGQPITETLETLTDDLSGQEWAYEVDRLTTALHTHCAHPDWIYLYTVGATSIPPATVHGTGWVENPDDPRHGAGTTPTITWSWRRPKTAEETA
jgi:hypothetical protein